MYNITMIMPQKIADKNIKRKCRQKSNLVSKNELLLKGHANAPTLIRDFTAALEKYPSTKNLLIGLYYSNLHMFLAFIGVANIFFNNNIYQLCLIAFIYVLDIILIIAFHDCPLTTLENKYIGESAINIRNMYMKNTKWLDYECSDQYELQLEVVVNIGMLVIIKIGSICFLDSLHILNRSNK